MQQWKGDGPEPNWLLTPDRPTMNVIMSHAGYLESHGLAPAEYIAELREVGAAMKTFLKGTPVAPVAPIDPTLDFDADPLQWDCTCPERCKRCEHINARRFVLGKEATEKAESENVVSTAIPLPRADKRPFVPESYEPTIVSIPTVGRVEVHAVAEQQEHATDELAALLRLSDSYRKQADPHSMSARAIANEIAHSVNVLRLLGAMKDKAGTAHVSEWNPLAR